MKAGALIAGKYRLVRPIGKGAMGMVWEAVNEGTSRQVAVKLILEPTDELRIRLTREAHAYGALRHRNIVEILDVGQTDEGDPFLVMQLLMGETLADRLTRQRRLGAPEAARIARDVARALAAAHAASIIHRDLKPANIFLHDEPGEDVMTVKVVDFGVSKNLLASDGLSTVAGGMVGSPAYMSPEQAAAGTRGPVDHRADLWSLGVVLFEMLTGVRPLQGDSVTILAQIVSGQIPRVTTYVRTIDPKLADLVARCLDRDLAKRVGSAAELAVLLQSFTTASQGSGAFSLAQSGAAFSSPVAQPSRNDAAVLASPRAGFASVPEREPAAAVLASPRAGFASVPERDPSVRSPRPQGGLIAARPAMPGGGDDFDEDQATAKMSPDMMRAFRPVGPPAGPPQMPPRPGATVQLQNDPALPPHRAPLPSLNQAPPPPPSFNAAPSRQDNPMFGSGSNWTAPPPTTAKLDPIAPWAPEPDLTQGGTMRMSPEDMVKIRTAAGNAQPLAPPPAPPPPPAFGPSAVSTTAPLMHHGVGDPSSADASAAQQQKRLRTVLLIAGAVVGVALASLAVVMILPGSSTQSTTPEAAPSVTASVAPVAPVQAPSAAPTESAAPLVAPPPTAAPVEAPPPVVPTVGVKQPTPKAPVAPTGTPTSPKRPSSSAPAPAPTTKPGKLPGFLTKKTNPTGI